MVLNSVNRLLLSSLIMVLLASIPVHSADTEPIKVLVAGTEGKLSRATAFLEIDPLTDPYAIPARAQDSSWSGADVRRFVRIYFPRTYEALLDFDYMMLLTIEVWVFSPKQQRMMHDSIKDHGLGGLNTRSVMSMHDYIGIPWADSILSDAFPNDADQVVSLDYTLHDDPMKVVINTHPKVPPVLKPYKGLSGVEYRFSERYGTNLAIPKEGAVVTSYSVGPYPYGYPGTYPDPNFVSPGWIPHSMFWRYGNGTTWTHQDMIGQYWNTRYNPYGTDMLLAEIIFSTGRDLPSDVSLVHRLRTKFTDISSTRSFIFSLLDFVDRFGANTESVLEEMAEIQEKADEGRQLYLSQEYTQASTTMEQALSEMDLLRKEALKLKDSALVWVYTVEWLSISGTSLIAGFVIWTLMVRRRLYKETEVTRLSSL